MIFNGQLFKQVAVAEHVGDTVLGVAHESHRSLGSQRLNAARERLVGHVVLHDVDQRVIDTLFASGEFIECNAVPIANQAQISGAVVHEQLRDCDLAAGD